MHVSPGEHQNANVASLFLSVFTDSNGLKPREPPLELRTVNPLADRTAAIEPTTSEPNVREKATAARRR